MSVPFNTNPTHWLFKSQRQRVSPFPNYFSMETVCNDMKAAVGFNVSEILYFLEHNIHYFFMDKASYERVARGMANKFHADPNLAKELVKQQHHYGKILTNFARAAGKLKLNKVSNKKLYSLFAEYETKYKQLYCRYGWVWVFEDHYIDDLLKIVESKVPGKNKAAVILDILTKEPSAMVATVELEALLKMGIKINANKKWVGLIVKKNLESIKKEKSLDKLIKQHEKNYFWVTRDYEDPVIDYKIIVERLAEYLRGDIKAKYKKLKKTLVKNEADRAKYLRELNFSKKQKAAFNSMRQVAYLKELRKRYVSESLYYFDTVLKEVGKRLFLSLNQVRHLRTVELKACLVEGQELYFDLNKRMELMLWYCSEGKPALVVPQAEAEKLFGIFCKVDKNATTFTGMPVSPGVARGPAKIIFNPNEVNKVNKGDIIVSIQVVPSFSTAIMKAAGLVCDGGHGITTHPATLAREAGIPAVIQTRFVREVVKDGDMLEVDGYKGVVKILK